jgi:hypothetical protein
LDGLVVKRDRPTPLQQLPNDHSVDDALRMTKIGFSALRSVDVS